MSNKKSWLEGKKKPWLKAVRYDISDMIDSATEKNWAMTNLLHGASYLRIFSEKWIMNNKNPIIGSHSTLI